MSRSPRAPRGWRTCRGFCAPPMGRRWMRGWRRWRAPCANDPRPTEQRRADACGALGRGEATLACQCGSEQCPVAAERDSAGAAAAVVIHVLAEQATIDGTSANPGYLPGFGILP